MFEKIIRRCGISTNILLLGIVSFLTDTSSEMIRPLLPLFIMHLGGTYQAIGFIGGIGDSAASILKVISGYLSDRTGKRKIFVFVGYLTSSIAKTLYAFATTWQHILLLKTGERTGKGLRAAPRDAIIANSTHHDKRGLAFGVHRAMDSGGAIAGSLLAIVVLSYFWFFELEFGIMYQYVFIIAGIIAFFALVPLHGVREDDVTHNKQSIRASFSALPGLFRIYVAIATIFALGNITYMFFILRAAEFLLAENGISVRDIHLIAEIDPKFVMMVLIVISALYMLFNITYTVFSIPSGKLSDRIGRRNVLIIGYSLFGGYMHRFCAGLMKRRSSGPTKLIPFLFRFIAGRKGISSLSLNRLPKMFRAPIKNFFRWNHLQSVLHNFLCRLGNHRRNTQQEASETTLRLVTFQPF
ncbi:MAG: MFS transporter [Candidatus Methanogasteraceae archaeon]